MRHLPSEKHSIAWFKLAECVSRGEKERALGVFRLLSHSLGSEALASQLLGDLMLAFNSNTEAITKYIEAALLYKKSNKTIEAMAVYEHLLFLDPFSEEYLFALLDLCKVTKTVFRFIYHIEVLINAGKLDLATKLIAELNDILDPVQSAQLNRRLAFSSINQANTSEDKVICYIRKAIDGFLASRNNSLLQAFLSELQFVNKNYYEKAHEYLKSDKSI